MYVPNTLVDRLEWVYRTYEHRPEVPYMVAVVAMYATGQDAAGNKWATADYSIRQRGWTYRPVVRSVPSHVEEPITDDVAARIINEVLNRRTAFDAVVPWVAKVIAKLAKRVDRTADERAGMTVAAHMDVLWDEYREFDDALGWLMRSGAALGLWFEQERPDLTRMSLEDVQEALSDFEVKRTEPAVQGHVTYRYGDGWTMQRLGADALEDEGELMQHCVGDYCEQVEAGEVIILSLRDPRGNPHVTIEVNEETGAYGQIMGKQNERPKPEYAARVREFIEWRDPPGSGAWLQGMLVLGWGLAGEDLSGTSVENMDVNGVELPRISLRGAKWFTMWFSECSFKHADAFFAQFDSVKWEDCNLFGFSANEAVFNGAGFVDCEMTGFAAQDARFRASNFHRCDMTDADLRGATFDGVSFLGVQLVDAELDGADLRYVTNFSHCNMRGASIEGASLPESPTVRHDFLRALGRHP